VLQGNAPSQVVGAGASRLLPGSHVSSVSKTAKLECMRGTNNAASVKPTCLPLVAIPDFKIGTVVVDKTEKCLMRQESAMCPF
jgi:hypothetical protein